MFASQPQLSKVDENPSQGMTFTFLLPSFHTGLTTLHNSYNTTFETNL